MTGHRKRYRKKQAAYRELIVTMRHTLIIEWYAIRSSMDRGDGGPFFADPYLVGRRAGVEFAIELCNVRLGLEQGDREWLKDK